MTPPFRVVHPVVKLTHGRGAESEVSMKLKNIRLTLANVNTTTNKKDMEAVETSANRVRLDDGTLGKDIESYSVHCLAYRGDILKVKVPKELAGKVTQLNEALGDDVTVNVTFTGLKLKAYAMKGNGDYAVNSGVSAKADDFTFTVQNVADDFEVIP